MAIAFVQSTSGVNLTGGTNTIPTTAFASPTTTGNTIIVGTAYDSAPGSITTCVDTAGNIYKKLAFAGGSSGCAMYVAYNIVGIASNVVTINTGFVDGVVFAYEISGLASFSSLDKRVDTGNILTLSSSISVGPTPVTTYPNEVVVVVAEQDYNSGTNTTLTVGAGYTNFLGAHSNFAAGGMEIQIVSAAATYTGTMGSNDSADTWKGIIATFADTAISPAFRPRSIRPHPFSPGLAR